MKTSQNTTPIKNISDLPESVRHVLPQHAQKIYFEAFTSAWTEYEDVRKRQDSESQEEVAHKVAWSAVEKKYQKNVSTGKWELNEK